MKQNHNKCFILQEFHVLLIKKNVKSTEKGDYKAKKQNLKNPDLSMK